MKKKMMSFMSLLLMTILLLVFFLQITSAGFECLTRCDCFYKSNKLIADCGARGIMSQFPDESLQETEKKIRSDIQILNMTRNTFTHLKNNIFLNAKMVNLQRIYFKKVALEKIDKSSFHPLANLVELDISSNSLRSIPTQSFPSIPKLRDLDLSENFIELIPGMSFHPLISLKTLNLEKNLIRSLDASAFVGLEMLETLKLADNQITFIDSQCFQPLTKAHSLTLSGNKWNCDCRLRQLRQFLLMSKRLSVYDEPKCASGIPVTSASAGNPTGLTSSSSSLSSSTSSSSSSVVTNSFFDKKVWTQMDLNSFICSPRIVPNIRPSSVIQVEPGNSVFMECAFYMKESPELENLGVKWMWQERIIGNRSKGLVQNQIFTIREYESALFGNSTERRMKVSRLEISIVLELNEGIYTCISQNKAGSASRNFSLAVIHRSTGEGSSSSDHSSPAEHDMRSSSSGSLSEHDSSSMSSGPSNVHSDQSHLPQDTLATEGASGDSIIFGLMVGVIFGTILVLGVIVVCTHRTKRTCFTSGSFGFRKRSSMNQRHNHHSDQSPLDQMTCVESEMEKLTSGSSLPSSHGPHVFLSLSSKCYPTCDSNSLMVNPIEKPPRQRPDCLPYSFEAEHPESVCWTPNDTMIISMAQPQEPSPCHMYPMDTPQTGGHPEYPDDHIDFR